MSQSYAEVHTICELPDEVLVHILLMLDCKTLVCSRQICRLFNDLYMNTAALQYKVDLDVAGMEDGPPSSFSIAERLQKLRRHQEAWATLTPSTQQTVPMLRGTVWELFGGVLAQARGSSSLFFMQLPSVLRGIAEKSWTIENLSFVIRDFGMDPSQDLLLMIQTPVRGSQSLQIHLRTLSTGAPHPAAANIILSHTPRGFRNTYEIQIVSSFIGILFTCRETVYNELLIWNWKTGALQLWYTGAEMGSFAFLSDRYILVAIFTPPVHVHEIVTPPAEPHILVVDLSEARPDKVAVTDAELLCSFHYPLLAHWIIPLEIALRSDPAPLWAPQSDLQVPFYTARAERLLVLTFWLIDAGSVRTVLLFTLASVLLSHIDSLRGTKGRHFTWAEWGPTGSRMMFAPRDHSSVWVCYVFGTKYVSMRDRRQSIQLYDFNLLPYKRRRTQLCEGDDAQTETARWVSHATKLENPVRIFENDVSTSLPYRVHVIDLPADEEDDIEAVMLSEDTLITMTGQNDGRHYQLSTF